MRRGVVRCHPRRHARHRTINAVTPALRKHFNEPALVEDGVEPVVPREMSRETYVVPDLGIMQWPWPGVEDALEEYPDPRPTQTCGSPRPDLLDAVEAGSAALLEKALAWEWVEEAGDGLGTRNDPTGQLSVGGANAEAVRDVWVQHPALFDTHSHTLSRDVTYIPRVVSVVPKAARGEPGRPFLRATGASAAAQGEEGALAASDLLAGSQTAVAKCSASALGWSVVHGRGDLAAVLLQSTLVNPNMPIIFHGVEPPRDGAKAPTEEAAPLPRKTPRRLKLRKTTHPAADVPGATSRYTLTISPLYYALASGQQAVADLLLAHPRLDPRLGIQASHPLSRVPARPCSALHPPLADREAHLTAREAAPMRAADIHGRDWVAAPRASKRPDLQKLQYFSFGINAS